MSTKNKKEETTTEENTSKEVELNLGENTLLSRVMNGKWSALTNEVEKTIAKKIHDRVAAKKQEILGKTEEKTKEE